MVNLCDYIDIYILIKWSIIFVEKRPDSAVIKTNKNNKHKIFKICAQNTDCISESNEEQVDNSKCLEVVVPMNNLTEYSNNYSKILEYLL